MSRKTVSNKQLAANRRNALKSTGPRTPEGKAPSSRNAIKHGILAQEVVIRDGDGAEDPTQFDAVLERLWDHFQPVGVLEETLVERIAVSCWRLRRAQRFEVGAIREQLDECNWPPKDSKTDDVECELEQAREALAHEQRLLEWAESRKEFIIPCGWENYHHDWDEVGPEHGLPGIEVLHTFNRQQEFLRRLTGHGHTAEQLRENFLEAQRRRVERLRGRVEGLNARLPETRRYDQLAQERAALLNALPEEHEVNKLIRYENMINRELDRALNQLERQQRGRQGDHIPVPVALDVNVTGVKEAG